MQEDWKKAIGRASTNLGTFMLSAGVGLWLGVGALPAYSAWWKATFLHAPDLHSAPYTAIPLAVTLAPLTWVLPIALACVLWVQFSGALAEAVTVAVWGPEPAPLSVERTPE